MINKIKISYNKTDQEPPYHNDTASVLYRTNIYIENSFI